MVDLLDVKPLLEKQKAERESRTQFQALARAQVALEMQYVTASREWNTYLQHLQALVEADERAAEGLRERLLGDLGCIDAERDSLMRRLKKMEGRIEARRDDMALPMTLCQESATMAEKA
jgi:hypothetical protein